MVFVDKVRLIPLQKAVVFSTVFKIFGQIPSDLLIFIHTHLAEVLKLGYAAPIIGVETFKRCHFDFSKARARFKLLSVCFIALAELHAFVFFNVPTLGDCTHLFFFNVPTLGYCTHLFFFDFPALAG
jgi:hypothetical protein